MNIGDNELLEMLRSEETRDDGFRMLMQKFGRAIYWNIRRIVVGHDDAEDVMQETCVRILENISRFNGDCQLSTWIYRIAVNEALASLRRRTRLFQSIDSLGESLTETLIAENDIDSNRVEFLMQKALLTLPAQQRIAFNLRYYDDLSYEEISKITGKSVGSLKTNYHYAYEKIKQFINSNSE